MPSPCLAWPDQPVQMGTWVAKDILAGISRHQAQALPMV
jgi:hypothetical protein